MRSWFIICSFGLVALLSFTLGCGPKVIPPGPKVDDHGHDHHHHGDHGEGPNGGHIVEIGDPGDHHLEWLHDDKAGKATFIVLDEKVKTEVPLAMESLVISVAVKGKPPAEFKVPAENLKDGKASRFSIVDEPLMVALEVGEGVAAKVKIGEKEHSVVIEHKEHDHDHKHDHKDEKTK